MTVSAEELLIWFVVLVLVTVLTLQALCRDRAAKRFRSIEKKNLARAASLGDDWR